MNPGSSTESYPAFARIGLRKTPEKTSTSGRQHSPKCETGTRCRPVCTVVQRGEIESIPASSYESTIVHCVFNGSGGGRNPEVEVDIPPRRITGRKKTCHPGKIIYQLFLALTKPSCLADRRAKTGFHTNQNEVELQDDDDDDDDDEELQESIQRHLSQAVQTQKQNLSHLNFVSEAGNTP
ncbi:hypothetical protein ANN_04087 [Periplaneta americana]|uniref:Uncharacterized protein n=1 Tax=Periplaneta americana TaxID=6978 RepID=A0ABQ8TA04_PERAM|nr:hypothetical protein ANN_04087 [Periplaneta americana]